MAPRIVRDNRTLVRAFAELREGDVVLGRIRMRPGEEGLLVDLQARGVRMLPSATAQLCSRSKVLQARILGEFMGPDTLAVHDRNDLLESLARLRDRRGLVCKLDRGNGGSGVFRFSTVEDVYTLAMLGQLPFPFVLQPLYSNCRDIRVVILGEAVDAYQRENPNNFRHNLHCGGRSRPWAMDGNLLALCRKIMARAGFPYAHLDFLVSESGDYWLSEINLRGGLRGSRFDQHRYRVEVERIHEQWLSRVLQEA